jgi:hypothetical protein
MSNPSVRMAGWRPEITSAKSCALPQAMVQPKVP